MRKSQTTKLFYNKWCYKICVSDEIIKKLSRSLRYGQVIIKNGETKSLNVLLSKYFFRDDVQFRFEGSWCQIYLNDTDLFNEIVNELNPWITEVYEPATAEEKHFLFDNKRKILCTKLPRGKYNFKITLKNNIAWPVEEKIKFREWLLSSYKEKIHISESSDRWLENRYKYVQEPFFYVKDQGTYSMISLYISEKIKKVEQYILKDKVLDTA